MSSSLPGHLSFLLHAIEESLKTAAHAVPYARIDGTTSSAQRQAAVEAFQKVRVGSCTAPEWVLQDAQGQLVWLLSLGSGRGCGCWMSCCRAGCG